MFFVICLMDAFLTFLNLQLAPVIPAVHATKSEIAWSIVKTGFATVSSLDAGWFGKGPLSSFFGYIRVFP